MLFIHGIFTAQQFTIPFKLLYIIVDIGSYYKSSQNNTNGLFSLLAKSIIGTIYLTSVILSATTNTNGCSNSHLNIIIS
jgi:hypothetical protein